MCKEKTRSGNDKVEEEKSTKPASEAPGQNETFGRKPAKKAEIGAGIDKA